MRNNCNKHRGKLNGRNGWCNHAYAIASLISSGCLLFRYISQTNITILEKLLGIWSNSFLRIFFMTFTHAEWANVALPSFVNFNKCTFLQQALPVSA